MKVATTIFESSRVLLALGGCKNLRVPFRLKYDFYDDEEVVNGVIKTRVRLAWVLKYT